MDLVIASGSVDLAHADAAPISGTPQYFTNGNPGADIPATRVPAYWLNGVQSEIVNVILDAGLTPDKADNTQLLQAIGRLQRFNVYSIGANLSLNATHRNAVGVIESLSGAIAIELPLQSSYTTGDTIKFWNISAYAATINRKSASADTINSAGTSIVVAPGDTLTLVASSSPGVWLSVDGSTNLQFSQGIFGNSLGSAGYQKLPSGLIVQWGTSGSVASNSSVAVTFPITFPNAVYVTVGTPIATGINTNAEGVGIAQTTSGATFYNWGSAFVYNGVRWVAIGK